MKGIGYLSQKSEFFMTENTSQQGIFASSRLVILGILVVIIVPALAFIISAIGQSVTPSEESTRNVLLDSGNKCVECHQRTTPRHCRTIWT